MAPTTRPQLPPNALRGRLVLALLVLLLMTFSGASHIAGQEVIEPVSEDIKNQIHKTVSSGELRIRDEPVRLLKPLARFYERRSYRPAWSEDAVLLPHALELVREIRNAASDGLRAADYHLATLQALVSHIELSQVTRRRPEREMLADIDILLSGAFLLYASHLQSGRLRPATIDAEGHAHDRQEDVGNVLGDAVTTRQVTAALKSLRPPHDQYARLKHALARYRAIAWRGGWPTVPLGPRLKQGGHGRRVEILRSRLIMAGDLRPTTGRTANHFDSDMVLAVRHFQQRHGLPADGIAGPETLAALNISAMTRIRQLEANLERWRWLPRNLGRQYIRVNIADFTLAVVEEGRVVLIMEAVVGEPYRRTPVFSATMLHLVLNPYWHVPTTIAVSDILPRLRTDTGYLSRQHLKVLNGWEPDARELDPTTIDWKHVSAEDFPYRFRQDPGPANALGRVKFMFPNRFDVYLHDTPARGLFVKRVRAFSAGCIRVAKPLELAAYVLRGDANWPREQIEAALQTALDQTIQLPTPIPVHILYWTAWADEQGVNFRHDIYERDAAVEQALRTPLSSP